MVAEIYGGISALKAAFDIAKGLKDINDATVRNTTAIELQQKIMAALVTQSTLLERISELEKEMARFEKWEAEKERYELKNLGRASAFAYMLKPDTRGSEPPHWVCANCYRQRQISIVQHTAGPTRPGYACPACETTVTPRNLAFAEGGLRWLD